MTTTGTTTTRALLIASAAALTAALTACGGAAAPAAPTAIEAPAGASPAAAAPTGATGTGAVVAADDQTGDGRTVVVREARLAEGAGWVVIRTDDDNGRVLGVAPVAAGQTGPVTVTLTEPVPATTDDLDAVLHADDGDGTFDPARDLPVREADDDADDDGDDGGTDDDVVDDDFDYRVA